MTNEFIQARVALLDAFEALVSHIDALILVGAQAIYLRTGEADVALAAFTTDGDLVLDPELLGVDPRVEQAMLGAGFTPDPRENAIGTWLSRSGVPIDLMVPHEVAGKGRRSVDIPPHDARSMRRARGLEAALIDKTRMELALENVPESSSYNVYVAGPCALLVAKLHKLDDRIDHPSRLYYKDAHDIYRLLVAIETAELVRGFNKLLSNSLSEPVTREAVEMLRQYFAAGVDAPGSQMSGAAEEMVGNPAAVALSSSVLAQQLLEALSD